MVYFPGWGGVQWQRSYASCLLKSSWDSRTVVQLSGTINLKPLKRSRRSKLQRRCVGLRSKAMTVEVDRKTLACSVSCLHCASSPSLIPSLPRGALQVMDLQVEQQSLWRTTILNKLSFPETHIRVSLSIHSHFMTLLLGPSIIWDRPQPAVTSLLIWGLCFPHDVLSFQSNPVSVRNFTRETILFVTSFSLCCC